MRAFFDTVLGFLLGWLPESDGLPDGVASAFTTFMGYVNNFDFIVPVSTIILVIQFVIAFELIILAFRLIKWVITVLVNLVPFT